jgi:hypothetical protein
MYYLWTCGDAFDASNIIYDDMRYDARGGGVVTIDHGNGSGCRRLVAAWLRRNRRRSAAALADVVGRLDSEFFGAYVFVAPVADLWNSRGSKFPGRPRHPFLPRDYFSKIVLATEKESFRLKGCSMKSLPSPSDERMSDCDGSNDRKQ